MMKNSKFFIGLVIGVFFSTSLFATMIGAVDFEKLTPQTSVTIDYFKQNGFAPLWSEGFDRTMVDSTQAASGMQALKITYPANQFGTANTGCQSPLKFDKREEVYASYYLRFSDNFSWGTTNYGGKLPGLSGGDNCSGGDSCDGTNGFSARLMWRTGGAAVLYLYHMDKPETYGEDHDLIYPDGTKVIFERGRWYHIAERVKINSGAEVYDGEVELWIDGQSVLLRKGLRFVSNDDKVDNFYISTFHGGNTDSWCPTETCYTWLDDIRVGTTYEDVAYQSCRKPALGNDRSLCEGAKSYQFASDVIGDNYRYTWLYNGEKISSESSVNVWNDGNYILIVDSAWCSRRDTVRLQASLEPDLGRDFSICATSFVTLSAGLPETPSLTYRWFKDNVELKDTGNKIETKDAGNYRVVVSSPYCKQGEDEVTITSKLLPVRDTVAKSGELVMLKVDGSGNYGWYDEEECRQLVEAGNTYTTVMPQEEKYLYIKDLDAFSGTTGKRDLSTNRWTRDNYSTEWMNFQVYKQLTIDSISIYPVSKLTAVIRILNDETGEVIFSRTFDDLESGENRLPLQVSLPVGNYRMDANGTTGKLYHSHTDEDISFPYEIENIITLNGANLQWINNKGWYLYFYNWRISVGNTCAATPVLLKPSDSSDLSETNDSRLKIYPKFTDGDLHISGLVGRSVVTIYAPNGRRVYSRRWKQCDMQLYIKDWKSGKYVVLVEDEKGTVYSTFLKF